MMVCRQINRAFLALTLVASLFVSCEKSTSSLEPGRTAPDFRASDLTGRTVYLNAELKTPVVLTFFATWCAPCREEIPLFADLHQRLKGEVKIICVAVDPENGGLIRAIAKGTGIPYPVLLDEGGKIRASYGATDLPVTFLIDTSGKIRSRYGPIDEAGASLLATAAGRIAEER